MNADHDAESNAEAAKEGPDPQSAKAAGATDPGAPASGSSPDAENPLAQLKADLEATRDKYLRTAADFDNYRKRARKDVDDAEKRAKESLLRDLLPVFDNLERAATSATQASDARAIAEGVRMVLKQFLDTLDRAGIKRVHTVGNAFDPTLHEAIQQVETAEHPAGTVIAEVQAGYQLGDRLVRAAMVVVAKAPAKAEGLA